MFVNCGCGTRIRVPDQTAGQSFRCPKCKTEIEVIRPLHQFSTPGVPAAPAPPPAPTGPVVSWGGEPPGGATGETCPICQSAIGAAEERVACPRCRQVHHHECW